MATKISMEDHELATQELRNEMQEARDKHDKQNAKLARRQEAEVTKRVWGISIKSPSALSVATKVPFPADVHTPG